MSNLSASASGVSFITFSGKTCDFVSVSEFAFYCYRPNQNLNIYPWKTDQKEPTIGGLHSKISLNNDLSFLKSYSFSNNDVLIFNGKNSGQFTNIIFIPRNANHRLTRQQKILKIHEFNLESSKFSYNTDGYFDKMSVEVGNSNPISTVKSSDLSEEKCKL